MLNNIHDSSSRSEILPSLKDSHMCIILCKVPDDTCARTIAKCLIDNKLTACITILPGATSFYYWQDIFKQQPEVQMIIKSHITMRHQIFSQIKTHHPYQIPELLVLPIIDCNPDYLSWFNNSLIPN